MRIFSYCAGTLLFVEVSTAAVLIENTFDAPSYSDNDANGLSTANSPWTTVSGGITGNDSFVLAPNIEYTFRENARGTGENLSPTANTGNDESFLLLIRFTTGSEQVRLTDFDFDFYATGGGGSDQSENVARSSEFIMDVRDNFGRSLLNQPLGPLDLVDFGTNNASGQNEGGEMFASGNFDLSAVPLLDADTDYQMILSVGSSDELNTAGHFATLDNFEISGNVVPEPGVFGLFGVGLLGAVGRRRR